MKEAHTMAKRFFVDTGDGVEYCETQAQAIALAKRAIEHWRGCCDPEWPEEVDDVCWGEVKGESMMVKNAGGAFVGYRLSDPAANGKGKANQ
jgi:hypothetical protein